MTKNRKGIILVICIVVGAILWSYCTFFALKNGWISIKNVEWMIAGCFIFAIIMLLTQIAEFLFNRKKAGRKTFIMHTLDYKMRVILLMLQLACVILVMIPFINSLSIQTLLPVGLIIVTNLNSIVTVYFMNGLHENGLMHGGKFYCWEKVITYSWNSDKPLIFKVENKRKGSVELKYFIKQDDWNEIQSYLQKSLNGVNM
jgi:vacuolar-type H+-ATPase subunit I/STV1